MGRPGAALQRDDVINHVAGALAGWHCRSQARVAGLECAPAYSPGTPAYKACMMRNAETGDEGYAYEKYDYYAD